MKKVVRDGKVAVLVSRGFGAGWYSWHNLEVLLFDPVVVQMVEEDRFLEIVPYCEKTYGDDYPYLGVDGLSVQWVPEGQRFRIDEYDGAEVLVYPEHEDWMTA